MEIKAKTMKTFLHLKAICTSKETINKTKRQPMDWEKIFENLNRHFSKEDMQMAKRHKKDVQ